MLRQILLHRCAHYNLENPHSQYVAYVKQSRHFTSLYPFLCVLPSSSPAVLLYLLRSVVSPSDQTVVFTATHHHVDYLNELYAADRDDREQLEGHDVYTIPHYDNINCIRVAFQITLSQICKLSAHFYIMVQLCVKCSHAVYSLTLTMLQLHTFHMRYYIYSKASKKISNEIKWM